MDAVSGRDRSRQLAALARHDPGAAERALAGMSVEGQAALVVAASAADRSTLLLLAPDAGPLVRALPPPAFAHTIAAADDDGALFARHATAAQLASAIDLDCRRGGRLRPRRFRRWVALLVAASEHAAAEALVELDPCLIAAGLLGAVRLAPTVAERVRLAQAYDGAAGVSLDDIDSDDEAVAAFLRLLDEAAPEALRELVGLLASRDAEELGNLDYAGYEARMASIGLRDHGQAAEVYLVRQRPGDACSETGVPAATEDGGLLREAMRILLLRRDSDDALIERLAREFLALANDVIVADGAGGTEAAAQAARAKAERLVATGLRALSGGDGERAADLLKRTPARALFQAGWRGA